MKKQQEHADACSLASAVTLNAAKAADDASRKRSRLGLPALVGTAQIPGQPDAKRRPLSKLGKAPSKGVKKPALKKPAEESRLGVRRQKSPEDVAWEEACQAVMGSRVEVWWEDDHCYYKVQFSPSAGYCGSGIEVAQPGIMLVQKEVSLGTSPFLCSN